MHICHHVDKLAPTKTCDLRDHAGQKCITSDVERHPETHVAAALVEDAAQAVVIRDVELSEQVAWRQGHLFQLRGVPGC
jgi:hypothetical protein